MINFEDEVGKVESKIKYSSFKVALLSDNFLYLEHPNNKKKYFQMNLNDFVKGDRNILIEFLKDKNILIKNVKTKTLSVNAEKSQERLIVSKKRYFTLISLLILSILVTIVTFVVFEKTNEELESYYSLRTSINSMKNYSLLLIVITFTFIYAIYLNKNKYKSKLIIFTYIISPIMFIMIITLTLIHPYTIEGKYSKDYNIVIDIFEEANVYLPKEGLSISIKLFTATDDNENNLPYNIMHKILINNGLESFEDEIINNNWRNSKSQLMKAKLNMFIDREADYYLIFNETAKNYNDDDIVSGLNKLYVFYYFYETKEIIIYEYYLFK